MSCVRDTTVETQYNGEHDNRTVDTRKGRFLRGLRRMFRRRAAAASAIVGSCSTTTSRNDRSPESNSKSRSTSELIGVSHHRKESAYGSGLSVSHDSVFTGERSGDDSTDEHSKHRTKSHRAELAAAVRRRGGDFVNSDDDEDLGLPRSPPASPQTDKQDKRHAGVIGISASSCSDGSLLSVGSSEMDEDSSSGHQQLQHTDAYTWYEPPSGVAPLSHSAARHKMAVRPRRTHPQPRRNRTNQLANKVLPITPEVNEEITRTVTPDVNIKITEAPQHPPQVPSRDRSKVLAKDTLSPDLIIQEAKIKSSSLPPGLALSQMTQSPAKLTIANNRDETPRSSIRRSKSSSQGKALNEEVNNKIKEESYDVKQAIDNYTDQYNSKNNGKESFFSRLLHRRSGKKKKDTLDYGSRNATLEKPSNQYKTLDRDYLRDEYVQTSHHIPLNVDKTSAQIAFAHQSQRRTDNKSCYAHDIIPNILKDTYSNYGPNNLHIAEDVEKIDKFKFEKTVREYSNKHEKELFNSVERDKRTVDVIESKTTKVFISNELMHTNEVFIESPTNNYVTEDVITPEIKPRKNLRSDFTFIHESEPRNIPSFNRNILVSSSASPPKSVLHEYNVRRQFCSDNDLDNSNNLPQKVSQEIYLNGKIKPEHRLMSDTQLSDKIQDENMDKKNSIGKSQSFRYPTDCLSIVWQDKEMPSLPAIVGISEKPVDKWNPIFKDTDNMELENFLDIDEEKNKRISTRNFNIFTENIRNNLNDSQNHENNYVRNLKIESQMMNNQKISDNKIDNDLQRVEAKIANIIGSKPLMNSVLKSSSLDSVKTDRENRRKTIAIETTMGQTIKENKENGSNLAKSENSLRITTSTKDVSSFNKFQQKNSKSDEQLQINTNVPEFLKIQLKNVDTKPYPNVVLTANPLVKKTDEKRPTSLITTNHTEINKKVELQEDNIIRSTEYVNIAKAIPTIFKEAENKIINQKNPIIKKSPSTDSNDSHPGKLRTRSLSGEDSDKSQDRKSILSFGSKSSLQSSDNSEPKITERTEETVVFRRKPGHRKSKDDEPELMKVFARRSLKLKDTDELEISTLREKTVEGEPTPATEIRNLQTETKKSKEDLSRSVKDRVNELAANAKIDSLKYRKEVADSTPEKRIRNRTFPDPVSPPDKTERRIPIRNFSFASTELKENKNEKTKLNEIKDDRGCLKEVKEEQNEVIRTQIVDIVKENTPDRSKAEEEEFRGILQVREQWERRARAQQTKAK